ncbi:MAG: hypothetical protein K2I05_04685 [Mailhella sp.]|nr:hypothetical protein [Mailhella sp.]
MTKEERRALARKIMREEEKGISPEVQNLGQLVLSEVFRLESEGDFAEAKAFEVFLPLDEAFLASLAPFLGQEEFEGTLAAYKEEKMKQRLNYLAPF